MPSYYGRLSPIVVSRDFRNLLMDEHPQLAGDERAMRLVEWSLFGARDEEHTGGVLIDYELLASIEGKRRAAQHGNYDAKPLLSYYKAKLPSAEWTEHHWGNMAKGRARLLVNNGLSKRVNFACEAELQNAHKPADLVYLVNGLSYTPARVKAAREADEEAALERMREAGSSPARELLAYLNGLPPHRFSKMLARMSEALAEAHRLDNPRAKRRALTVLRAIQAQAKPTYGLSAAGRSSRVFGLNASIVHLPRKVRNVLRQDFTNVDLRSAQLAIVAKTWAVDSVKSLLSSGASIWDYLFRELALAPNNENKHGLKKMLYALLYGGGLSKRRDNQQRYTGAVMREADYHFGADGERVFDTFMATPLVSDLVAARKQVEAEIKRAGGAFDAFGSWIELEKGRRNGALSVASIVAQSWELRLMLPIVNAAQTSEAFSIVLWLHDGCSLAFRDASRRARIVEQLQARVANVASELDIATVLEVETK